MVKQRERAWLELNHLFLKATEVQHHRNLTRVSSQDPVADVRPVGAGQEIKELDHLSNPMSANRLRVKCGPAWK